MTFVMDMVIVWTGSCEVGNVCVNRDGVRIQVAKHAIAQDM
eukprot:gene2440-13306_t